MNPSPAASVPRLRTPGRLRPPAPASLAPPTTLFERVLLAALILVLPFENTLPTLGPFSVALIGFAMMALYVFVRRTNAFFRTLGHPITLAFAALLGIGSLMEVVKESPGFYYILQLVRMVIGILLVAALARDRKALAVGFGTLVFMGLLMAALLFRTGGRTLYAEDAEDFFAASKVRAKAFEEMPITANLNQLGFLCGLGGALGVAMALPRNLPKKRRVLVGLVAAACLLGVLFTVSRSGIVVAAASIGTILAFQRGARLQSLLLVGGLVAALVIVAPSASLERFSFGETNVRGKQEGRSKLYQAFYENAADFIVQGVGENYYWEQWSVNVLGKRLGAHNAVLHLLALWGGVSLAGFALLARAVYRSLPPPDARDPLNLCLWAMAVAVGLRMLATHNLPGKEFSIIFGLLMAAHLWRVVRYRRPVSGRPLGGVRAVARPRPRPIPVPAC